jgi:thioredoxin-related protein
MLFELEINFKRTYQFKKERIMKKLIVITLTFFPVILYAQPKNDTIEFVKNLSWEQILDKAKTENKPIFIDAMATWCGPCKKMEDEVYTDYEVANEINKNYIPVKVQMDRTLKDLAYIKNWYDDAAMIQKQYSITAMPTLIFLNANGKLQYLSTGYLDKTGFLELVRKAANSNYDLKLTEFENKTIDSKDLLDLSLQSKDFKLDSLAKVIATVYKRQYLDETELSKILNEKQKNYLILFSSLFEPKDRIFQYLYHQPEKADIILKQNGFSKSFTDNIIAVKYVYPNIWRNNEYVQNVPNWRSIEKLLSAKFDIKTAHRIVLDAKIQWYSSKKLWNAYINFNLEKIESDTIPTLGIEALVLNNFIYDVVFRHSEDKAALLKCARFMELMIKKDPEGYSSIDTYSCILYKAGHKRVAILQEEKALQLAMQKNDTSSITEFTEKIEKMKNNLPIWKG